MQSIKQLTLLTKRIVRQNLTNADTVITVIAMPVLCCYFLSMFLVAIL